MSDGDIKQVKTGKNKVKTLVETPDKEATKGVVRHKRGPKKETVVPTLQTTVPVEPTLKQNKRKGQVRRPRLALDDFQQLLMPLITAETHFLFTKIEKLHKEEQATLKLYTILLASGSVGILLLQIILLCLL
jgi:hypothetical protein